MIARAAACAILLAASASPSVAAPGSRAAAPTPVAAVPATGDVTIAGAIVHLPAALAGWTRDGDALRGPGSEIRVAPLAGWCGQWAGALRTPTWAPTSMWPSSRTSPGGVTLCLQRHDDALLLTLGGIPDGGAPDADTAAVLLAVADGLRPPLAIANPGGAAVRVRLPVPAAPIAGSDKLTGFDGVESFTFSLWIQEGACFIGGALVADPETPEPWLRAHEDLDDRQLLCAELADRAVGLKWPLSELPLRGPMMDAVGGPAVAALGAAVTNAKGTIPILGKPVRLDPQTAGRWKAVTRRDVTELTSLEPGVPFAIDVVQSESCPAGDRLPEERAQGFAPPGLWPVRIAKAQSTQTTLELAMCLRVGPLEPVLEIRSLAAAAEPPSGPAAVQIRALLVAAASRFGQDAEQTAATRKAHERDHRDPDAEPRPTQAHYRTDVQIFGGLISLYPPGTGADRGPLVGGEVRASPQYGFGLAANLAGQIGYTSGIEGEVRGSVGAGFGLGVVSIQATAGMSGGSVGNGGAIAFHVQGGALVDLQRAVLSASVLRTFAAYGDDETRYDFRFALCPTGERATYVAGAQLIEFGENGGSAVVAYLGFGFTSAHEPPLTAVDQ